MENQFLSKCDQVIFMERGRIVDQGEHQELMKRNTQYSSLIQTCNLEDQDQEQDAVSVHDDQSSSEEEIFSITLVLFQFLQKIFF